MPPGKPLPCPSQLKCFGSLSRSVKIEAPWVVKILHDSTKAFLSIFHITIPSVDCVKEITVFLSTKFSSLWPFLFSLPGMTRGLILVLQVIPSIAVSLSSLDLKALCHACTHISKCPLIFYNQANADLRVSGILMFKCLFYVILRPLKNSFFAVV